MVNPGNVGENGRPDVPCMRLVHLLKGDCVGVEYSEVSQVTCRQITLFTESEQHSGCSNIIALSADNHWLSRRVFRSDMSASG